MGTQDRETSKKGGIFIITKDILISSARDIVSSGTSDELA